MPVLLRHSAIARRTVAAAISLAASFAVGPFAVALGIAYAADSPSVTATSAETTDLQPARAAIKAKKYDTALAQLKVLVVKYQTPDVYSLLGHALWKTGDSAQGMIYYNKALAINPLHRGALEYQGELYVKLGQIDKAKENLQKLKGICPFSCEELSDLKEAIEHAPKGS
jgi:tetratricopeptide (TPR) repeat protein